MQPGVNYFINRPQNKPFDQTDIEILAYAAFLLAGFDNFRHQVLVHLGHFSDLILCQAAVLMGFNLIYNRHVSVLLEFHKMPPDEVSQFVQAVVGLIDGGAKSVKNLLGPVVEKLHQNIVFILEIEIDGAIGNAGLSGDLGNGRLVKPLTGKYLDGRFQDTMILIIFLFFIDFEPPVSTKQVPSK